MPVVTPTPELFALIDEEIRLAEAADRITERRASIKAMLLRDLPVGTHTIGEHEIQVRAGQKRLNAAKVAANHPPETDPELYTLQIDTAKVKHHLAPAELEGYMTETAPSVVVKS